MSYDCFIKFANEIKNKGEGFDLQLFEKGRIITIDMIHVPKIFREQGIGSLIMETLCKMADENKLALDLIPGASSTHSRRKLIRFYKKFGFIENKGLKNENYLYMYRLYNEIG